MTNLQKAISREISIFTDTLAKDGFTFPSVTKAAFCKARMKLKHSVFVALNDIVIDEFYKSKLEQTWHGFRIVGIDGTSATLPSSKEIIEKYGVHSKRKDGKEISMAQILVIYDTLNHITLAGSVAPFKDSEQSMLWKCLPGLNLKKNDLLVFDRLFASRLLIFYLEQRGVQFCMRMKVSEWKIVRTFCQSGKENKIITLDLPQKDEASATDYGIKKRKMKCRLTRVILPGGEIEILLTSLKNEKIISAADLKELYALRWPIENGIKILKHHVCIENFSGKSDESVRQDFYAKILTINLVKAGCQPLNDGLQKQIGDKKFKQQINNIDAIFTFKCAVVSFFITKFVSKAIKRAYQRIINSTEPLRPNRKFPRNHQRKRKHYMNYKPV